MSFVRPLVATVLAAFMCSAIPASIQTSPGSSWKPGDLFVSVWTPAEKWRDVRGEYLVFGADGVPTGEAVGVVAKNFTSGCAIEPVTGYLWTTSYHGNTIARYDDLLNSRGQHDLIQTIDVRPYTFVNGRAPGAVRSISFDGSGNAYVGTTDGSNRLLKFSSSGQLLDAFAMPAQSKGVAWFDIATDQRTMYYTSDDNVVHRYDLAARAALPDFATLMDGTVHALRLLPNDQGLLVAGSIYVTRLDMSGQVAARLWLPERQFSALNITPDGRQFWTSTQRGELYRFDVASGAVLQGPVPAGAANVMGLCLKLEYTAAENVCRTAGPDGQAIATACP